MIDFEERRLVFRADGNAVIGLGHLVRLLALADMLRGLAPGIFLVRDPSAAVSQLLATAGWPVHALSASQTFENEAEMLATGFLRPTDVVVLDGYNFSFSYQQRLRASSGGLVYIDDLRAWPVVADVLINHSPGVGPADYDAPATTRLLLGPAFSLLRTPFLTVAPPPPAHRPRQILVCFGGADPLGLTARTLRALLTLPALQQISLVVGEAYGDASALHELVGQPATPSVRLHRNVGAAALAELLRTHEAVVVPASTILIEALVLGRPAITGYYADNQRALAAYVHDQRQAFSVGNFASLAPAELARGLGWGLNFFSEHSPKPYVGAVRPDLLRAAIQAVVSR